MAWEGRGTRGGGATPSERGFTLVELLVVIAIVGLLLGLLLPALGKARGAARQVREQAAAQQLMVAYQLYADANGGWVLPGYVPDGWVRAGGQNGQELVVMDENGERLEGQAARRYPWRLAPYMEYNFAGMYKDDGLLARYQGRSGSQRERERYTYIISVSPSLGINADFVGGCASSEGNGFDKRALQRWGSFYVTRMDQARRPDHLVVFASSRGMDADEASSVVPGFHLVKSPYYTARRWSAAFDPGALPESWGYVDPRHAGRAIVGAMDGHAQTLDAGELQDMRWWSDQASDAAWVLGSGR